MLKIKWKKAQKKKKITIIQNYIDPVTILKAVSKTVV